MKLIISAVFASLAFAVTPSHAEVDVCKLLTIEHAHAATKMKVDAAVPMRHTDDLIGKCRFTNGGIPVFVISAYKPERIETYKQSWAHPMALKYEPVSGVGDYAYFRANPRTLDAGIGNSKAVSVQLLDGPEGAASLEILKTLAREALAKL
jgi:hypothetical protein